MPTREEILQYLSERDLVVVPFEAIPSNNYPPRCGGGGAAFTGVQAGCYEVGLGTMICVNGKGQVLSISEGAPPPPG